MNPRSLLLFAPVAALLVLTACATTPAETDTETTASPTVDTSTSKPLCKVGFASEGCEPPPDEVDDGTFQCNCEHTGPMGYPLMLKNQGTLKYPRWTCIESDKCCPPGVSCPPSTYVSVYNPCYYPTPYVRCSPYGGCWCSSYP